MSKKNAVDLIDELLKRLDAGNKKLSKRALDKTLDSLTELSEKLNKEMAKQETEQDKKRMSKKAEESQKESEDMPDGSFVDLDLSWDGLTEDSSSLADGLEWQLQTTMVAGLEQMLRPMMRFLPSTLSSITERANRQ